MDNKLYLSVIHGNNFNIISAETVKLYKSLAGKVPQNGIRYIESEQTVLLQSDTMGDILDTVKNGAWAHTVSAVQVQSGWKIVVVPSNKLQAEYKEAAIGVSFIATTPAIKSSIEAQDLTWTSEQIKQAA